MNATKWGLVRQWVTDKAVPLNGRASVHHGGASNGVALPAGPMIAAQYVAQALINIELVAAGSTALPMPVMQPSSRSLLSQIAQRVIPAMPIAQDEWTIIGQFIEEAENARRDGASARVLFDGHDGVNKVNIAHHLACHRLGGNTSGHSRNRDYCAIPNSSPHDSSISILIVHLDRIGPLRDWTTLSMTQRRVYMMHRLVTVLGYSRNAAAGLVGNFDKESGLIPQRIEGSTSARPRSTRITRRPPRYLRYTIASIQNRNRRARNRIGPPRPGVGLAQWTSAGRRSGFFTHSYRGHQLGGVMLYAMNAQLDYMRHELTTGYYARVRRVLIRAGVSLNDASDEVCYNYERSSQMFTPIVRADGRHGIGPLLPRSAARVQTEFAVRRRRAQLALDAYNHTNPVPVRPSAGDHYAAISDGWRRRAQPISQQIGV